MSLVSTLIPIIQNAGLLALFIKPWAFINFLLYRMAAGSGVAFLFRKAKRTGNKLYYLMAAAIYLTSWFTIFYGATKAWEWCLSFIKS